ncbi:MAG: hypothetical protein WD739_11640 [Actinomycetota bacterium]
MAFAGRRSGTAVAEALGFPLLASPTGSREDDGTITSLIEFDMEREFRVLRDFYCRREARSRVTRILELTDEWSPDLLVCDEVDIRRHDRRITPGGRYSCAAPRAAWG